MIVPVPAELADAVWPQVAPLLAPAFDHSHGELEPEDILALVRTNDMWLLTIHQDGNIVAAAALEQVQYPRKRSLRVVALGGAGLEDWLHELQQVTNDMAKKIGASFVEIQGRPGWNRALRKLSRVRAYAVVMTMEVV